MNKTLVSNCKKEKVSKFGQQLKNMAPVLEIQNTDQSSKDTNKKIKSTKFKTHTQRFKYFQQNSERLDCYL